MSADELKQRAAAEVDRLAPTLVALSRDLHAHPELMFEEVHAHRVLTDAIEAEGIEVTRNAHDLDTAFRADVGTEGPIVAVCCEYDALEEIGHACGHNVIATAGLGAGLAAAAIAEAAGGRIRLLGTPAEEGGNGKGLMFADGAFADVDAALMVHPGDRDLDRMTTLAVGIIDVTYLGHASHAAAAPWLGRNALDAAVNAYNAVSALRQQLAPDQRVHGAFESVPTRSNVIPERVSMRWVCRGANMTSMRSVFGRMIACLKGGGEAAGCEVDLGKPREGSQVLDNGPLVGCYVDNAVADGRTHVVPGPTTGHVFGSTDMGVISRNMPSIHPVIGLAPEGVAIHERAFAAAAGSADGDRAVIDGAKAMARTVVDIWLDAELRSTAWEQLRADNAADPMG